jgi:hypothetical protein
MDPTLAISTLASPHCSTDRERRSRHRLVGAIAPSAVCLVFDRSDPVAPTTLFVKGQAMPDPGLVWAVCADTARTC